MSREFCLLVFFHESVSPKHLSIPLEPFRIFYENSRRYSRLKVHHRCQRHQWQMEKIFEQKNCTNFVWAPLGSRVNIHINFCLQVYFKVSAAWYCSHYLPPVSLIPVAICQWRRWHRRQLIRWYHWHRWQICHRCQQHKGELVAKFAAGVVDTCGKFAAGVVDTGGTFADGVVDDTVANYRRCRWMMPRYITFPKCSGPLCSRIVQRMALLLGHDDVCNKEAVFFLRNTWYFLVLAAKY